MRRAPIPPVGIVADDLTGAMDASGAFAVHGLTARVMLSPSVSPPEIGSRHALCYNTQTRDVDSATVSQTIRQATGLLLRQSCSRLYKKIDSTLRGHIGLEALAVLDESGARNAFVCPAFPAMGRTVREGTVYVGDRPLAQGRERSSSVVDLLERQTGLRVGLVALTDVEQGEAGIEGRIEKLLAQGRRLVVLDAVNDRHLERIATVLASNHSTDLAVGSAGLAYAVASGLKRRDVGAVERRPDRVSHAPLLLVSGSLSPVTQAQLRRIEGAGRFQLIPIEVNELLGSASNADAARARVLAKAQAAFAQGDDVGLSWSGPGQYLTWGDTSDRGRENAVRLTAFLWSVTSSLVEETPISGFLLVGGETAYSVLAGLRTEGIDPTGEILPGMPMGTLFGGEADGRFVVTKAGGFGDQGALAAVIRHLRGLRVR